MTDVPPPTMVVFKYQLHLPEGPSGTLSEIELPKGATILRVGWQSHYVDGNPTPRAEFFLWALICKDVKETEKRKWLVVGTGHEFSAEALKDIAWPSVQHQRHVPCQHQETVIALNGRLVFHFWISYPVAGISSVTNENA